MLECSTGENRFGSTNISWVICRFSAVQNYRVTRLDYCGVMVMWDLRGGKSVQPKRWEKPFWKRWCSSWMFCVSVGREKDVTLCARVTLAMVISQAQLPRGLLRRSGGCCSPDSCVAQWVMDGCWSFFVGVKFILRQMTTFLIKEELRIWEGRITNRIANSHELQERGCFCWREWKKVIDFGVQIDCLSFRWLRMVSQCYSGEWSPPLPSGFMLLVEFVAGHLLGVGMYSSLFNSVISHHSLSPNCYLC